MSTIKLAGLIGPTLLATSMTEAMNMERFTAQATPVVYLNGTMLGSMWVIIG